MAINAITNTAHNAVAPAQNAVTNAAHNVLTNTANHEAHLSQTITNRFNASGSTGQQNTEGDV